MRSVQDFILLYLCLVWIRRIRRQEEFKIPLCNPSGGNFPQIESHLELHQASMMELLCENNQWLCHVDCFCKKAPPQISNGIPNADLSGGAVNWDVWLDCKYLEFLATGCCTRKWSRFDQTIRNLTSDDLGIPLVVIWLGVTRLKKARVVYLLDLPMGRGKNGQCECVVQWNVGWEKREKDLSEGREKSGQWNVWCVFRLLG